MLKFTFKCKVNEHLYDCSVRSYTHLVRFSTDFFEGKVMVTIYGWLLQQCDVFGLHHIMILPLVLASMINCVGSGAVEQAKE